MGSIYIIDNGRFFEYTGAASLEAALQKHSLYSAAKRKISPVDDARPWNRYSDIVQESSHIDAIYLLEGSDVLMVEQGRIVPKRRNDPSVPYLIQKIASNEMTIYGGTVGVQWEALNEAAQRMTKYQAAYDWLLSTIPSHQQEITDFNFSFYNPVTHVDESHVPVEKLDRAMMDYFLGDMSYDVMIWLFPSQSTPSNKDLDVFKIKAFDVSEEA